VTHVANLYRQEIKETLQLLGVADVGELNRSHVDFPAERNTLGSTAEEHGDAVTAARVQP
jgi:isopentenyl diphosphate isomerase/L-lactate dehydrogenase-like FMN-dependent dehydrogenase